MGGRRPGKNRRRIRWNTLRIFSGRERLTWSQIVRRSRTVNVGHAHRSNQMVRIIARRECLCQRRKRRKDTHVGPVFPERAR
jgi:hypothetical protein